MMRPKRLRQLAVGAEGEQAQGVVEFAVLVTILALLFMGTLDFARFMYFDTAIVSAARVGAETASNHCAFANTRCALDPTAVSDTLVLWDTYCEATPSPKLKPQYSTCTPTSSAYTWTPSCVSGDPCTNCTEDICVSPSSRTTGTQVTVTVGYSFKPYTLFISPFFSERSCFTGDSTSTNHHTICAASVGQVS